MPGEEVLASWVIVIPFVLSVVHAPAPSLGNIMLPLGNQRATACSLPGAKSRKQPQRKVAEIIALADQKAKSPNSRNEP
jgi:hypothetical protein